MSKAKFKVGDVIDDGSIDGYYIITEAEVDCYNDYSHLYDKLSKNQIKKIVSELKKDVKNINSEIERLSEKIK